MIVWETEAFHKTEIEAICEFADSYFQEKRKVKLLKKTPGYFKMIGGIHKYHIMLVDNIPPIYRVVRLSQKV